MPHRAQRPASAVTINANTIVGIISTLVGGVVLYMVTSGMGQVKATANDVKEVKTVLPFMQRAIDVNQTDMKESLKELKGDVKNVQQEQAKVREDLMKQSLSHPEKPHE